MAAVFLGWPLRTGRAGGGVRLRELWGRTDALQVRRKQPTAQINAGTLTNGAGASFRMVASYPTSPPALIRCAEVFLRTRRASARTQSPLRPCQPPALLVRKRLPSSLQPWQMPNPPQPARRQTAAQEHPKDRASHAPAVEQKDPRAPERRSGPTGRQPLAPP